MMASSLLISFLKGALIGTGAILPGISGGVLCVAMGVYRPMMALLAHPIRELKARLSFFLPLIVGFLLGVLGLSRIVEWLFRASSELATWLFIGLILGTMPSLWRESGREGRPAASIAAAVIAFGVTLAGLLLMQGAEAGGAQGASGGLTRWRWLLCGVLWGIGLIAPGMSPSSLFLFMGVYQPMAAGIADLSLPILIPMGVGLLACVLTLSHLIGWLLKRYYAVTMHAILGVALASTVAILPIGPWATLCFAAGLAVALWMDRVNQRMESEGRKE